MILTKTCRSNCLETSQDFFVNDVKIALFNLHIQHVSVNRLDV